MIEPYEVSFPDDMPLDAKELFLFRLKAATLDVSNPLYRAKIKTVRLNKELRIYIEADITNAQAKRILTMLAVDLCDCARCQGDVKRFEN